MIPKRPFIDRLQDRLWTMRTSRQATDLPPTGGAATAGDSVSGTMAWPGACAALAEGKISSRRFRRIRAVMEVVETLGPCEGRHHAQRIRERGMAHWLTDERLRNVAAWGDPMTWPGILLDTPQAFAPTSLRYLSHAVWLIDRGFVTRQSRVVEIGVGYGGLAAMNAMISGAHTLLVDLPEVEMAAMKSLEENGLADAAQASSIADDGGRFDCLVSNYAFTELSAVLQKRFIESHIIRAGHGMIVSNANVFAAGIGGMDNETIVTTLRSYGIDAVLSTSDELLSQADHNFGSTLIWW